MLGATLHGSAIPRTRRTTSRWSSFAAEPPGSPSSASVVLTFDGPHVIRFEREPSGATHVQREPAASAQSLQLKQLAEERGAKPRWVTGDGFTQLPEAMSRELEIGAGKDIWFLRGPERWEAWPEDELEHLFGGPSEADDG